MALPALLGLRTVASFRQILSTARGLFYGLKTIFLASGLHMALARLKSIEAPAITRQGNGENYCLGLDRAPEVRTLRVKVKTPADQNQAFSWSSELCKEWMAKGPTREQPFSTLMAMFAFTTATPSNYPSITSRASACDLSATADYWVNAMDGKPFFVMSQSASIQACRRLAGLPTSSRALKMMCRTSPSSDQLEADPLLHRFTVVFDREGYSPNFSRQAMKRTDALHA